MNRRESPRVEVRLRCLVSSPGAWLRSAMFTENISRNGVLLSWLPEAGSANLPECGQMVTLEIDLPAHHGFGRKCIHCQGTVVRVTAEDPCPRVALNLDYMKFRAARNRMSNMERLQAAPAWLS